MYNSELTDQIENDYRMETAIIQAERQHEYDTLQKSLSRKIVKISRKEAESKYLYRRHDGQHRFA